MKKVSRIALVGVIIAILIALVYTAFITTRQTSTENTEAEIEIVEKAYSIEKLTPEWIIVKANGAKMWGWDSVETLAEGLKELGREYKIISVMPILEHFYQSAPTGALLVEVEPRY